jgi:hypothetical protein
VRCVLFHWSADDDQADECPPPGWDVRFHQPVFESDTDFLKSLPRPKLDPAKLAPLKDKHVIAADYEKWKTERDRKLFSN